jgi:hypothetical protein
MPRKEATTVFLVIAAWVMGALMGSQIHRPAPAAAGGVVRFEPGRYLLEEPGTPWVWAADFENPWFVRPLPMPPSE